MLRTHSPRTSGYEDRVKTDPGLSGKDLNRPQLQRLLAMIDAGHVDSILLWRLDRLSRNLGDLILLADRFGQRGVALHSFTEQLDLSSATGRMFFNILGSFAQYYREALSENVRMGMMQAIRQGRYVNRPPTGYDLAIGLLIPNAQAATIRRIFTTRGCKAPAGATSLPPRGSRTRPCCRSSRTGTTSARSATSKTGMAAFTSRSCRPRSSQLPTKGESRAVNEAAI